MDVDLYQEFESLVDALDRGHVEYAVCGGIAVVLHGHVRATKDIDVLIVSSDVERAKDVVRPLGFSLPSLPMRFDPGTPAEREVHRISKVIGQDVLTLDLITLGPGMQAVWDTRQAFQWKDRRLVVVSREGLAQMKRLAGRKQDLADLENLGLAHE